MTNEMGTERPVLRLAWVGVGGQGVVLGARLLAEVALAGGRIALMSEVHGMSQRGGVVETTVVIGPPRPHDVQAASAIAAPSSPMIEHRGAHLLMATEPLEALRAAPRYLNPDGVAVIYLAEAPPPTVFRGGPPYPSRETVLDAIRSLAREVWTLEPGVLPSGHPLRANVALLGAAIRTGFLPFTLDDILGTIPRVIPTRFVESNIESLRFGHEEARCVWRRS